MRRILVHTFGRQRAFVIVVVALALAGVATRAAASEDIGSWRAASSPLGSDSGPTVTLADGRVLGLYNVTEYEYGESFAPGERAVESQHSHLVSELYEPSSRSWVPGPSPPGEPASTAVALPHGGALLLGETLCERTALPGERPPVGEPERICRPTVATYMLNAGETEWTPTSPMHVARTRPSVVPLSDGRILVAGGFGAACSPTAAFGYSCPPLSSAEVFNPAADTWTATPPMSGPRAGSAATLLSDGTVLLVGGEPRTEDSLRFDPRSERWSTVAPPPSPLTGASLLPLTGDRAIAFGSQGDAGFDGSYGGAGARAREICRSMPEIYDAAHSTWTPAPPLPGRSPYSCAGNAVPIAGGQILLDDAATLDAHQRCWTPTSMVPAEVTVPLLSGEALAFVQEGSTRSAETYTQVAAKCSTDQQIRSSLFEQIAPQGASATPAAILARGYRFAVRTTLPGKIHVKWYSTAEATEGSSGVLLADAHAHSPGKRPVTITVRLTAKGKQALAGEMAVTAQGTFAAKGRRPVTASRPFMLHEANRRD